MIILTTSKIPQSDASKENLAKAVRLVTSKVPTKENNPK